MLLFGNLVLILFDIERQFLTGLCFAVAGYTVFVLYYIFCFGCLGVYLYVVIAIGFFSKDNEYAFTGREAACTIRVPFTG